MMKEQRSPWTQHTRPTMGIKKALAQLVAGGNIFIESEKYFQSGTDIKEMLNMETHFHC